MPALSTARILSRAADGLSAPQVEVEVHLAGGLPAFHIVGLPAPVVRESRERVRAALQSCGYRFPTRRITVNLAPVELSKQGGRFDLPIALGVLVASGQLQMGAARPLECFGELGLAGELRPVEGLFVAALHASRAGHDLIVPQASAAEVQLSGHPRAYGATHLRAAAELLAGRIDAQALEQMHIAPRGANGADAAADGRPDGAVDPALDLADVVGQPQAKRALLIAAAGSHGVLLVGPPGSGKSMLAARLPSLLPRLSEAEALELAGLAALSGQPLDPRHWRQPPFRSPHHTSSAQALIGGAGGRPGELSLAHRGVLFLDELPEFDRRVLEALREPLETGEVSVARAGSRARLPARFQLIAAMNPCACGYLGDSRRPCRCTPGQRQRYRRRISGPLLDRIDIRVTIGRLEPVELAQVAGIAPAPPSSASSESARLRVQVRAARERRLSRSGRLAAHLSGAELRRCCPLAPEAARLLRQSCQALGWSGRGVQRLLALSRTIADLADSDPIEPAHLAEAIQLRRALQGEEAG